MEHGVTRGGWDPLPLAYCRQLPSLVHKPPLPPVLESLVFASNQKLEAGKAGNEATVLHVAN